MQEVLSFLTDQAIDGLLPFAAQAKTAERYSLSVSDVEEIALSHNILPARYQRNQKMISTSQQLTLFKSRVAVLGCGGLGGYIIEELARIGVGHIIAVDPDVFEEHNLNRQLFATPNLIGEKKVQAAARRVAEINPAVTINPIAKAFNEENGSGILQGVDVAADALDSVSVRLSLAAMCNQLGIPLVHGAIGGWFGHLAVQFPDDKTLEQIYSGKKEHQGIEASLGNPSFTPAVIASMEVAEIVKILLKTGESLRYRYLAVDLYHMEINTHSLDENEQEDASLMATDKPAIIRMFGLLHTIRKKQGQPVTVEMQLTPEGRTARQIARELQLPLDQIEAVFCNHLTFPLDHIIKPGDRVAFVPYGTPGPHRYFLGIKQAGDRSR